MGQDVIHGSRGKMILLLLGSLVFVIGGGAMLFYAFDWRLLAAVAFFGLCGAAALAQVIWPPALTLTADGFAYRGPFGKGFTTAWDDVDSFHIWKNPAAAQRLLAWRYRPGQGKPGRLAALSSSLGGDGALPGMLQVGPDRLLEMMTARLQAARGRARW